MEGNDKNYKGVMLCTRPQEALQIVSEKPFCARVVPPEQLGLNPCKKERDFIEPPPKQRNIVLMRHKQWLQDFQNNIRVKNEQTAVENYLSEEKNSKVRNIGKKDRDNAKLLKQKFKEVQNAIDQQSKAQPDEEKCLKPTVENIQRLSEQGEKKKKKKERPLYTMTEEMIEKKQEEEHDDLLKFIEDLDYEKYINDMEVQTMVNAIKERVNQIKEEIKNKRKQVHYDQVDKQSEIQSQASQASVTHSVTSERTQEAIQELQDQIKQRDEGKQDWDKSTVKNKKCITFEEKISKHVADEILRNYKNLQCVYSNKALRKLLESKAKMHLLNQNEGIKGPHVNVTKEKVMLKDTIDPNTLPYLHRNPAI